MTPRRILLAAAFFWCTLIVATPILASFGGKSAIIASFFYEMFSRVCHQIDSRSFHIAGFKLGVCIRCTAIYTFFLSGMVLFPLLKKTAVVLQRSSFVIIISLIPMSIDVGLAVLGIHESNVFTRMTTGALFGFALSIVLVPTLEEVTDQLLSRLQSPRQVLSLRGTPSYLCNPKSELSQRHLSNHHQSRISHATKAR